MLQSLPISALRPGAVLSHPMYDSAQQLLLSEGVPLNGDLLELLVQRGVESVLLHANDLPIVQSPSGSKGGEGTVGDRQGIRPGLETALSRQLDAASGKKAAPSAGRPFSETVQQHGAVPYQADSLHAFRDEGTQNATVLNSF